MGIIPHKCIIQLYLIYYLKHLNIVLCTRVFPFKSEMAVFKAVTALTVLLILLSESTAQLEEFEWKKLVCALFTGVKLSDGRGGLLFTGRILNILTDRSSDRNVLGNMRHDQNYRYFPSLAAAFGVTSQGGFEEVFFNSPGMHAEQKVINQNYQPGYLKSIAINFSPCHKCVQALKDKYLRQDLRPVIQFSWIHNYPRSMDGYDAIRHLKGHGFNLEVWETEILIAFLLEHSPNPTLHDELSAILDSCREALLERDDATQELIKTIYGIIPDSNSEDEEDEEDEQEEEAYWPGWPGRSYHDSDDDDDDYGAGTGGSGTTGGGGGWSRLCGLNVLGSYYGYRGSSWWGTGATAQHSSGWNHSLFDLAAFVLVGIWVMLLAVSVFLEFLNLLKV